MSASLTSHQYAFIERVDEHPIVLDLIHYIYYFFHQLNHLFILEDLATEVTFEHADLRNRVLEGHFSESDVFECIIAKLLIAETRTEVFGGTRT
jgi:hypothetical protein